MSLPSVRRALRDAALCLVLGGVSVMARAASPVEPPAAAEAPRAPAGATPACTAADVCLTLDDVVARARSNRDLLAAGRVVEAQAAALRIAGVRPNPVLSVGSTQLRFSPVGRAGSSADTVARVDQLVERGDKRALRVAGEEARSRAAAQDRDDVARRLLQVARDAFWNLKGAQERAAIAADVARLARQGVDAAQRRLQAGDVAGSEVARLQVEALRLDQDAAAADADRRVARTALALLLAAEAEAPRLVAVADWPGPPAGTISVDDTWVEARPDVLAARARVDAAERGLALARALRTRDLSVGVQLERVNGTNTVGVGLSVPLFVNHAFEGEIARAATDRSAAQDVLDRVRAQAAAEIALAVDALRAANERLRRIEGETLPAAERAWRGAEFAYRQGASPLVDLLDARRTYQGVLLDRTRARTDAAVAADALDAARGLRPAYTFDDAGPPASGSPVPFPAR